jgi:acyl carrier protein
MTESQAAVAARVRAILSRVADLDVESDEADIIASGRLDSLALIELIFSLEEEFGLTVALDRLEIEDFRSVRTIALLVLGHGAVQLVEAPQSIAS